LVIKLDHPVRNRQRIVIGQGNNTRPQANALRPLRRRRDKKLGRGNNLIARRMVLADPRLVVAQPVQMLHQLEIAVDAQRGVFVDGMKWRQKRTVTKLDGHERNPVRCVGNVECLA